MKTRIITAVIAVALLIPVLIFSATPALPILIALCSLVAVYEMVSCLGLKKAYVLNVPLYAVSVALPFVIRYTGDLALNRQIVLALLLAFSLYFFGILTFSHGKYKLSDISNLFFTTFYTLGGFNAILLLRDYESGGKYVYLLVFIGAWVTDTFAYFCGMLLGRGGKHKLIPDVSPKKTVEGSIGGIVFCMLSMVLYGYIIHRINPTFEANYLLLLLGGLLISVVSQLGDLCMSVIKRTYGIKDYGKLFPGHGGMLDRFDSVLAVSIVLSVFCSFFDLFEVI